jgi:hypothetical protein
MKLVIGYVCTENAAISYVGTLSALGVVTGHE